MVRQVLDEEHTRAPAHYSSLYPSHSLGLYLTRVIPRVSRELRSCSAQLENCTDLNLYNLALAGLRHKKFHSQGGSFYALYNPSQAGNLTGLIVALQTISDYLDNLCDRGGIYDEAAFRCLHHAMIDAVNSRHNGYKDYYRFYPSCRDGGYLQKLVSKCRAGISRLAGYEKVEPAIRHLVSLYADLQVYKHLAPGLRSRKLKRWFRDKGPITSPPLFYWEFAAASGSTLAIFALFGLAASPHPGGLEARQLLNAYFPWICGLHILLDYWVDQEEDRLGGDFNFIACYAAPETAKNRLHLFLSKALEECRRLPNAIFHRTIIRGLLAVYLSDPKVNRQKLDATARSLLEAAGPEARQYFRLCKIMRKLGIL